MTGQSERGKSDIEVYRAMLDRAGVVYEEGTGWGVNHDRTAIVAEAQKGPANLGYFGFEAVAYFDSKGALTAIGSWE